jgi:oligosaccharide repeat unit polymerase
MFEAGVRLIALVPLGFLVRLFRLRSQSWYSPAPLFAGTWFLATALPLVFAPDYNVWMPAVWLLIAFVAVFGFAATVLDRTSFQVDAMPTSISGLPVAPLRYATIALSFVGVISVQILLQEYGKSLLDLTQLETWIELGASFSLARYEEDYVQPVLARVCSVGFYCGALFGAALYYRTVGRFDRLIALLPLGIALAYSAILTTRAVFLCAVLMWLSCGIALAVAGGRPVRKLLRPRTILTAVAVPPIVLAFFVALQLSRGGKTDLASLPETVEHLRVWFFGHLPSFATWLRTQIGDDGSLRWGQRTFAGLFQLAGIARREQGVYGDFVNVGNGDVSNIYTLYRSLIEDFGIAGALFFVAGLGLLAGHLHGRLVRGGFAKGALYSLVICFIVWSPIGSFCAYNTLIVAFALFALGVKFLMSTAAGRERPARISVAPSTL